ncbi:MAG TPA: hypothetical protein VFG55_06125 [Rhodanobacteraceae bacterium]|nr:hypothetical protein [Rhodanobacteraceae bacterium]
MRIRLALALVTAAFALGARAGTFDEIDVPGGQVTGLSHNGRIATGIAGAAAWRWNKDRAATFLTGFVSSHGMNSWAQPVAGAWTDPDEDVVAALAYSNSDLVGGPVVIGGVPGGVAVDGVLSEARDVSDDGTAVGLAHDADGVAIAFRWTAADGIDRLTVNRPANSSRANAISTDGRTIVGANDQADGFRSGVIWRDGVPLDLVDGDGDPVGEASAVSGDGLVVVGTGIETANGSEAWRWTAASGVQAIGFIGGSGGASGLGVSDDGNVVVGTSGAEPDATAVIWTPAGGMQRLSDYLAGHGVSVPDGWVLNSSNAVSASGEAVAGWGIGPDGPASFVADLRDRVPTEAVLEAHGTVAFNSLQGGPFAGVAKGSAVTMTFRLTTDGSFELEPGEDTRYPIEPDTFRLDAGGASDTLVVTEFGPAVDLTNDFPLSDGIHLFSSPMAGNEALEFELFNPDGNLFDSDDLDRIDRTVGPELFEKIAWSVSQGNDAMVIDLDTVAIDDYLPVPSDLIFADGFD